jgi:hypothetical protein
MLPEQHCVTATQSIQFLAASGVRSQRKLQQILDPTVGLGVGCSKSTCGCGRPLWRYGKNLSSSNLCGTSCGIAQKEGAEFSRNPGHVALGLFGARVIELSLGKGSFCSAVNDVG